MAQFTYDFSAQPVATGVPTGWTDQAAGLGGHTWSIVQNGSTRNLHISATGNSAYPLSFNATGNQTTAEMLMRFKPGVPAGSRGSGLFTAYSTANGLLWDSLFYYTSGFPTIAYDQSNSFGSIGASVPYSTSSWYLMRYSMIGSRILQRVWLDGTPEPTTWDNDSTDNVSPVNGLLGILLIGSNQPVTMDISHISFGTAGSAAPPLTYIVDKPQTGKLNIVVPQAPIPSAPSGGVFTGGFGGILGWGTQGYGEAEGIGLTASDHNQVGKLKIVNTQDKAQTGKLRVQQITSKDQTGKLRIRGILDRTQVGKLRVQKDTLQAQSGRMSIRVVTDRAISGKLNISSQPIRSQSGRLSIKGDTTRDQTGILSLASITVRSQSGRLRVGKITDQSQIGRLFVQYTQLKTQLGRLRVYRRIDADQVGQLRISKIVTQNQIGKLLIIRQQFKDQTGRMSIYNPLVTEGIYVLNTGTQGTFETTESDSGVFVPTNIQTGNF